MVQSVLPRESSFGHLCYQKCRQDWHFHLFSPKILARCDLAEFLDRAPAVCRANFAYAAQH